jgi:uncharacterized protein (DUF1499 family)
LKLRGDPNVAWNTLLALIASRPRMRIVSTAGDYLHLEEKSRLLGFVDDVEFHLRPSKGVIAVRSASRSGYFDLGVNRKRIESIRVALREKGVVW